MSALESACWQVEGRRLVGRSRAMEQLRWEIWRAAHSDLLVVEGETGVGKDLVARLIHRNSRRAEGPFVVVDCGAIPAELWTAECFGTVRGAYTGARDRVGLVRRGRGGTVYVNEFQEVDRRHQAAIKGFVETGRVRAIGSDRDEAVDVRVIIGSNRPLAALRREGVLAADVYYRLAGWVIRVPPLRARREDIPVLADYFVGRVSAREGKFKRLSREAHRVLAGWWWPGNVRELERVVTTGYWQSDGPQIDASVILSILDDVGEWGGVDLPERHGDLRRGRSGEPPSMDLKGAVAAYERALLEELLATSPSLRQAAQRAGLRLSTLQYKMRKLGLKWDDCLRRRFHPEHSD